MFMKIVKTITTYLESLFSDVTKTCANTSRTGGIMAGIRITDGGVTPAKVQSRYAHINIKIADYNRVVQNLRNDIEITRYLRWLLVDIMNRLKREVESPRGHNEWFDAFNESNVSFGADIKDLHHILITYYNNHHPKPDNYDAVMSDPLANKWGDDAVGQYNKDRLMAMIRDCKWAINVHYAEYQ